MLSQRRMHRGGDVNLADISGVSAARDGAVFDLSVAQIAGVGAPFITDGMADIDWAMVLVPALVTRLLTTGVGVAAHLVDAA